MKSFCNNFGRRFKDDENGNSTIDWIVLASGIVTLGLAFGFMVSNSANAVATDINTTMESLEPATAGS